jgi:multidrug efflux system membrane fusion protein
MRGSCWILIAALGGALGCKRGDGPEASAEAARAARVIPVTAAPVAVKNVPIFLDGLGNVIAFKTVTVHSQVDGRLDKVLFKEGQEVKAGTVLAQIDPRPFQIQLHQAEGALARDTAQLHDNQANFDRYLSLRDQKLIAQQQVDDSRAALGQLSGAVEIDKAQIEQARLNLDYARITSPLDGVTGVRLVDPGNVVHAADQTGLVVITQLQPIAVLFTLPEDDLPAVMEELATRPLDVEAWSRNGEKLLDRGKVQLVDNQINQATATIRMKAVFPNQQRQLWPNQFIKTRLLLTTRQNALVVPATVVQRGPKGSFAYVIKSDGTVDTRPVTVDLTQGEISLIKSGLKPGEQVVVDGQNQLRPGARVQARPAAASGDGSGAGGPPSGAAPAPNGIAPRGGTTPGGAPGAPGIPPSGAGSGPRGQRQ